MTDKTIAAKIVKYLKSKGITAIVNTEHKCISAIFNNNNEKQYYFFAETKKELLHKTKLIGNGNLSLVN